MAEDEGKNKSSLAWKFAKAAGKAAIIGGLSFVFGIAVSGLFDYHLWHEIAELKPIIQNTEWIKDMLRADVFFGYSFVDGVVGFFNLFSGSEAIIPIDQAQNAMANAIPTGPSDFQ